MKEELAAMKGLEAKQSLTAGTTLYSTTVDSGGSFARPELRGSEAALTRGQLTGRSLGGAGPSPFSVTEMKHEIAQECLAFCRDRLPDLIAQAPPPPTRPDLVTPEPHPHPPSAVSAERTFRSEEPTQ